MNDNARFEEEDSSELPTTPLPRRSGPMPVLHAAPLWRGDPRFLDAIPELDALPQRGPLTGPSQVFPVVCDVVAQCLPLVTAVAIETYDGGSQMTVWCAPDIPRYQLCAAEARAWSSLTHFLASRVSARNRAVAAGGHPMEAGPDPSPSYVVVPLDTPGLDAGFVQFEMQNPVDTSAVGFLHHAVQRLGMVRARTRLGRAAG